MFVWSGAWLDGLMERLPGVLAKEVEISWACRGGGVWAAAAVVVAAGSNGPVLRRLVSGEVVVRMAAECDVRTVRILLSLIHI